MSTFTAETIAQSRRVLPVGVGAIAQRRGVLLVGVQLLRVLARGDATYSVDGVTERSCSAATLGRCRPAVPQSFVGHSLILLSDHQS